MNHGDEREMESGLIFNQLICEFESCRPCHDMSKVAELLERPSFVSRIKCTSNAFVNMPLVVS